MKTVFRPFWSYDLPRTEAWLAGMARQGWLLAEWNLKLRRFTFRQGKPDSITYRIGYAPYAAAPLSSSLTAEGWRRNLQQAKWSIYENNRQPEQINAYPTRKDVIRRNRKISYVFMGILLYLSLIALIPLLAIGISISLDAPFQVQPSPMWVVTWVAAAFALILLALAIYSVIKLRAGSRELLREYKDSYQVEDQLTPGGTTVSRMKLGWMYAPDKLEQWLEDKEQLGWNLYKVGLSGTLFRFSKGSPRRMDYHADYQVIADDEYFRLHREAGWNKVYSSPSSLQKWTIWGREYQEGAEHQEMYSDQFHRLKHARKVAVSYTLLFLPLILLYSINLSAFMEAMLHEGVTTSRAWQTSLIFISILLFGSFAARSWLYYRRLKKQ